MTDTKLTSTNALSPMKWGRPANATFSVSLEDMLKAMQLLGDDAERKAASTTTDPWRETPPSMQVIRAGVLGTTKRLTAWVTGVGGLSSAVAVVTAFIGHVTDALTPVVVATLLGGASFVLAAGFISIAMLASSDIRARGEASASRNHARADVASAFMAGTAALCEPPVELSSVTTHTYVPLTDIKSVLKAHEATARIRTTSGPGFHRIKRVSEDNNCVVMPDSVQVAFKDIAEVSV